MAAQMGVTAVAVSVAAVVGVWVFELVQRRRGRRS